MRAECTMAEVRPTCTHSCRNTEFKTCLAAGLNPNEMFEIPSVVCTPGKASFSLRIASMVSIPSRRVSSWPVAIGKVSVSTVMSTRRIPHVLVRSLINLSAIANFVSAVLA